MEFYLLNSEVEKVNLCRNICSEAESPPPASPELDFDEKKWSFFLLFNFITNKHK